MFAHERVHGPIKKSMLKKFCSQNKVLYADSVTYLWHACEAWAHTLLLARCGQSFYEYSVLILSCLLQIDIRLQLPCNPQMQNYGPFMTNFYCFSRKSRYFSLHLDNIAAKTSKSAREAQVLIVQGGFRGHFKCLRRGFGGVFLILKNTKFMTLYIANIKEFNWHCFSKWSYYF